MQTARRIQILDTTLRDGDQAPGFAFTRKEKIITAELLERMGVDVIEAGFPASSVAQFEDVKAVAGLLEKAAISAMARAVPEDIIKAGKAIEQARMGVLHTSIATSPLHRKYKLRKSADEVLALAVQAVHCARSITERVEIGAEDAARTEFPFLKEFCCAVTEAGATVVNISDTVGYIQPDEYFTLVSTLLEQIPLFANGQALLSVHCHNDLGLATANTLAGLRAGAGQAEVTILGIGERAGNAPLEEVVMALRSRSDHYKNMHTGIEYHLLGETLRAVSGLWGFNVPVNKPVAGANAAAHGSGIHQNGVIKNAATYALFNPQEYGLAKASLPLSRHSGAAGLTTRITELTGSAPDPKKMNDLMEDFKATTDQHRILSITELLMLLKRHKIIKTEIYSVSSVRRCCGASEGQCEAEIILRDQQGRNIKLRNGCYAGFKTLLEMLNSFFKMSLSVTGVSFSGAGDLSAMKGRLETVVIYDGQEYVVEAFGEDQELLFVQALLDVINLSCYKRSNETT